VTRVLRGSRKPILSGRDAVAVAPAIALFLGLALHEILLNPTWVGDDTDDGAYLLMSRNIWRFGAPLLNQSGSAHWSSTWSPAMSILFAPFGALPMGPSVVAERIAVVFLGVVFLLVGYVWMRHELALSRIQAGLATICVAGTYALARNGALVLSDVPAAAALVGGIVFLRRDRTRVGVGLLVLSALIRPINVAALAAAVVWILLRHRPRAALLVGTVGAIGAVMIVVAVGVEGGGGYFSQVAHPGVGGIPRTLVDQAKGLSWYPLGWFSVPTPHGAARIPLKLVSFGLLGLVAFVAHRRRLHLEAMIVTAILAVLLVFPGTGASDARYLIPFSPLFVGAIFAGLALRGHGWTVSLAAVAAAAAIAGDVYFYQAHTPSAAVFNAQVAAKKGAYRWVKGHVAPAAEVVALNDIQSFLYSGHVTLTGIQGFRPGQTFVIRMPPRTPLEVWHAAHILDGFRGRQVYRRGSISVVRVDARG
jgi:hypothetical protein